MKKLGIIQPGKIGDIVICLPIAKWYSDKGYKVIWPVDRNIINNFIGYVDYVDWIPIDFDCRVAHQVCFNAFCNKVIDLSFTITGANTLNTENYLKQDQYSFDEYKYFIADVPFEEKWNLQITRNEDKENVLYNKLNLQTDYVVVQQQSSDRFRLVEWENSNIKRIDIDPKLSSSVFEWLKVLENAKQHILIASSLLNVVDQLNIRCEKHYVLMKEGYDGDPLKDGHLRGFPRLKIQWIQK